MDWRKGEIRLLKRTYSIKIKRSVIGDNRRGSSLLRSEAKLGMKERKRSGAEGRLFMRISEYSSIDTLSNYSAADVLVEWRA